MLTQTESKYDPKSGPWWPSLWGRGRVDSRVEGTIHHSTSHDLDRVLLSCCRTRCNGGQLKTTLASRALRQCPTSSLPNQRSNTTTTTTTRRKGTTLTTRSILTTKRTQKHKNLITLDIHPWSQTLWKSWRPRDKFSSINYKLQCYYNFLYLQLYLVYVFFRVKYMKCYLPIWVRYLTIKKSVIQSCALDKNYQSNRSKGTLQYEDAEYTEYAVYAE